MAMLLDIRVQNATLLCGSRPCEACVLRMDHSPTRTQQSQQTRVAVTCGVATRGSMGSLVAEVHLDPPRLYGVVYHPAIGAALWRLPQPMGTSSSKSSREVQILNDALLARRECPSILTLVDLLSGSHCECH
mmetsp:Transcript_52920/g.87886  ORF Transcript_52920/g.87886 Transcript_52920/m.87886 type:complete len:132 (+) Transcript_52920:206-601(+)